ncbi:MAG: Holliday junction branch migration DNA helicase RuvB [Candidatus Omnitrophica bacterium]|nr:Holliday junction branch migration DNA helicase RuvB [Candidatus Omnitrophota bacterium]
MEELKRIVLNQETEEDRVTSLSLRPERFKDFIGQKDLIDNLRIAVQAAQERKEPLEHMLFSGPPGLGKTSLAHIISHEMNARITVTSGPAIERAGDFIGILTNLEQGDILFIDEIHRLSKTVEEFLYPAMESFKIDFVVDKGPYAKTINFTLKPFTLIGATTRSGLLASPLRDRFGIFHHLDFYAPEDLAVIVMNAARKMSVSLEDSAALEIARRARGTPRIAIRLLKRVRDFAQILSGKKAVDPAIVLDAMARLKVDSLGLDEFDRKILHVILDTYNGGPVGIEALAATLNEEVDTLVDVVEPYLLKAGFLRRTSRGREITEKARQQLCSRT